MSMFFNLLTAINNPNQQVSVSQLETVTNTVQQLASTHGVQSSQMQTIMSTVGRFIRPVMQQQQRIGGRDHLTSLISQVSGGGSGMATSAIQSLIPSQLQTQIAQIASQKTGLDTNMIEAMIPSLLPAVMGFLKMGANTSGENAGNPLLSSFLDADRDGDCDLGDVLKFSTRFLNPS